MQIGQEENKTQEVNAETVKEEKQVTVYHKTCKYSKCGKEFTSTSRNQRYCSDECCEAAQEINKKKTKTRRRKRKEYDQNKEINRALSSAYALAHKVADLFQIPKVCNCHEKGYTTPCSGEFELHHENGDPFDNSPWNLKYYCRHHHAKADDEHANVNMVDTYNKCVDEAGFEDDDKKHIKMIQVFKDTVEGVQ